MSTFNRITNVFNNSKVIPIDNSSKIILMSDVHRGTNLWSDNFAHNENLFFTALYNYYNEGYTYIEIGDGDELWENRNFAEIRQFHSHIFDLLSKFHTKDRLYLIYGNHDVVKRNRKFVEDNLYYYYDDRRRKKVPLFKNIVCHEGLILNYSNIGKIFVTHGHQVDFFNDRLWWFGRFLVRYIWKPVELYLGFKDRTSPAKNYKKKNLIEKKLVRWSKYNNQMLIAGHTHRPRFPDTNSIPYFNTGSCVHPRSITGIEIENGEITLVKWSVKTKQSGVLYVAKEILVGPKNLYMFFQF